MTLPDGSRKSRNPTATALFGVASIQGIVGFIGWSIHGDSIQGLDRIIVFSGIVYVVLGIVSYWIRRTAAMTGAVLYAAFLGLQASRDVDLLKTGLIFKLPIVVLLLLAVLLSCRNPRISTRSEGSEPHVP